MSIIAHQREIDCEEQTLEEHLFETSEIAETLCKKIGVLGIGELSGLLHDIGKYSDEFQNYLKSATGIIHPDEDDYTDFQNKKGKIDHSTAGAQYIWGKSKDKGNEWRMVGQVLSVCLASHHSGLIDILNSDGKATFLKRIIKPEDKVHLDESINKADIVLLNSIETIIDNLSIKNTLVDIIKNIARKNGSKPIVMHFQFGLLMRYIFSCLIDADRINTSDFESPENGFVRNNGQYLSWKTLQERLDTHLKQFDNSSQIGNIRSEISNSCYKKAEQQKGIFSLTVPTGGGKTLSSLRFALKHAEIHNLDRIFYVIPYTSIIDQNAAEVRRILEKDGDEKGEVVLEYHSNLVIESIETNWKEKILAENWDAPIIFTTSVQLLETLFGGGTRNPRRFHSLVNSVIIFDEIQTLPIRTIHMFNNAIKFLSETCGSSIVLCTATQPLLSKVDQEKGSITIPPENELINDVDNLFTEMKRVEIINKIRSGSRWVDEEIVELAGKSLIESGSCLVIVNTKSKAKNIYLKCKEIIGKEVNMYHLSTNMCSMHRMEILKEIQQKLGVEPVLCVSTQLMEAGVDIDFGTVIRSIAGFDSIAQAGGRCNRHGKRKVGKVYVLNPEGENIKMLPEIYESQKQAERVFREYGKSNTNGNIDWLRPEIMDRFFEYYFFQRKDEMDYPVGGHNKIGDTLLNMLSLNIYAESEYRRRASTSGLPLFFKQSFMSAGRIFEVIGAGTQGIIVPYGDAGQKLIASLFSAYDVKKEFLLLKKAQRYSVNVYPNLFYALQKENAIYEIQDLGVFCLNEENYSGEFGLSSEIVGEMKSYYT